MATATCSPQGTTRSSLGALSFTHHFPARSRTTSFTTSPSTAVRNQESRHGYTNTLSTTTKPTLQYPRHHNHNNQRSGATAGPSTITSIKRSSTITTTIPAISTDDDNPYELDERPRKRARSEPPTGPNPISPGATPTTAPSTVLNDTVMADHIRSPLKASRSVLESDHQIGSTSSSGERAFVEGLLCPTVPEDSESQESQSYDYSQARSLSPAPTEVDDPEPEFLESQLQSQGIKIRDFHYEPKPKDQTQIPELFDQYDAIAEFEYRLSQNPRLYPIAGKTLRRLLELGWIDMEEVVQRCDEMDLEELRKVDSRPAWPFSLKFRKPENHKRPDAAQREHLFESRKYGFMRLDRIRRNAEYAEGKRERDHREAQEMVEKMRRTKGKGVAREDGGDDEPLGENGHKRKRGGQYSPPPQASQPLKQYPAPLSTYDPEIYPEAAGVIESQSQSQGRTIPLRFDTPPLEEEPKPMVVDNRPNALKRGLKRTLSRTQTFTQL